MHIHKHRTHPPKREGTPFARCSQPLSTNQTPHTPPPKTGRQQPTPTSGAQPLPVPPHTGRRSSGLVVSKPNSVFSDSFTDKNPAPAKRLLCTQPATHYRRRRSSPNHRFPHGCGGGGTILVLLRKEVIQPHLPVRLPCYDFVPIADPTFDGSLPYGLGHRLRVLPTFMT